MVGMGRGGGEGPLDAVLIHSDILKHSFAVLTHIVVYLLHFEVMCVKSQNMSFKRNS